MKPSRRTSDAAGPESHDDQIDDAAHVIELGPLELYSPQERRHRIDRLIESLIAAGKKHFVVDISELTLPDAAVSPLELLLHNKQLQSAGCSIALVCPDENARKILEVTGLDQSFSIHPSRIEALRANARSST